MLVLAALGVDPQFGWAKKSGEGVTRFVNEPAAADAVSNSAIHIREGAPLPEEAAPVSAASRVLNAHSASQSAKVTQLRQELGPNNVLGREMNRVKDYVKVGHRGEKDHGRANKGGRHQEPARRGGNDRTRSLSPARLRRRSEPATIARSRGKPQADARDEADEQGVFVKGPAHKRHTRVADGGYQKSALKQKHAPALHLNHGREGKPAGEYDLETKTYVPAGEGQQQAAPAVAVPAVAVPAAAAGLLGEEQLKSLGALQRAAGEKMRLMGETPQQQGKQQGKQQETPPPAEQKPEQKLEAQKQETPQTAEALPPVLPAELQPPGGKLSVRSEAAAAGEWRPPAGGKPAGEYDLDTRTFTTPAGEKAGEQAGEQVGEKAAAPASAFGEHEHGAVFQKVEEKLKAKAAETNTTQVQLVAAEMNTTQVHTVVVPEANQLVAEDKEKMGADEKSKLLGERGAGSMVATGLENATALAQGVQRSFGSAQKELTSDLHSLEAGGKLTQANANDAVRNWLSSSHEPVTSASAGVKGAPGMVAAEEATPYSALPWYKRFGPFDTSM